MKKILIVAGEPSGDLHASNLVRDIISIDPDIEFFGLGGELSRAAGVDVISDISKLALVGLVEVWKNIFAVKDTFQKTLGRVDTERPDLAILVDYPGFNLRLAKELKRRSIPVVYYISPQIWAWGADRIDIIKRCVRKMIVFFKFEEELYRSRGINVEFVGHPLIDTVKAASSRKNALKTYGLTEAFPVVALLPGSRQLEVKNLLRTMVDATDIVKSKVKDSQFIIAKHPSLPIDLYKDAIGPRADIKIAENDTYNVVAASDFAMVASGTATLETAILGTPLLVTYKANLLTYIVYKFVATIRFLGIVNIIAGKEIAPELLQYNATPEKLAHVTIDILTDDSARSTMIRELGRVRSSLGAGGASLRAAQAVLREIG
jgi:lipid-A-disaccharide synthase